MAESLQPYKNLKHTLLALKGQVIDSIPFAEKFIPEYIKSPMELFYFLRHRVTYENDPKGIEYIQTMQTLMNNGGYGDCDCFSVTALASLYICRFQPMYVELASNNKFCPTHIYTSVYDPVKKKICPFDLTNPIYNYERPYKYHQRLLVIL